MAHIMKRKLAKSPRNEWEHWPIEQCREKEMDADNANSRNIHPLIRDTDPGKPSLSEVIK